MKQGSMSARLWTTVLIVILSVIICGQVPGQSAQEGEQIVAHLQKWIPEVGVFPELYPINQSNRHETLQTLRFPRVVWDVLTLDEKSALALHLSAVAAQTDVKALAESGAKLHRNSWPRPAKAREFAFRICSLGLRGLETDFGESLFWVAEIRPKSQPIFQPESLDQRLNEIHAISEIKAAASRETGPEGAILQILRRGVVINARARLYRAEMAGSSVPGVPATALVGGDLGFVRTGFLMSELLDDQRYVVASLSTPLEGAMVVAISKGYASALGRDRRLSGIKAPEKLEKYPLSPATELLDPFNQKEVILSNARGTMVEAYLADTRSKLGVVETNSGLFLGYLRERNSLSKGSLSWKQVRADNDWKNRLKRKSESALRKGQKLIRITPDKVADHRRFRELADLQITPSHHELILSEGINGVASALAVELDGGYEAVSMESAPESDIQIYREFTDRVIDVSFSSWTEAQTAFEVVTSWKERTMRVSTVKGNRIPTVISAPKAMKRKEVKTLDNDLEGSCRFIFNGEIIEIRKSNLGFSLVNYVIEENAMYRPR